MASRDPPYDPYIPAGTGASGGEYSGQNGGNTRTAALQAQIDDTVHVMKQNINKVQERGDNIDTLQDKADQVTQSAIDFNRVAAKARKRMMWENNKWRIMIIIVIILIIVAIAVGVHYGK